MIAEKLENIGLRAGALLGQVSSDSWQALRLVPGQMELAAKIAHNLEEGEPMDEALAMGLSVMIRAILVNMRSLAGVVKSDEYETVYPLIMDLDDVLPIIERLEAGLHLVFLDEAGHARLATV